ncbi:hypothetical protein, partial [Carnobacterium sp.]|uniref:hypothetical protein n=1 Tax=Carnobacterium sp. TaxID=48221 RepID=UPI0028AFB066
MLKSTLKKYKETYQKKYLLQRILLTYSFSVIFFALILFVISAASYMNSVKRNTQHNLTQTYDRVTRLVEDKERISDNFANYLYSNTEALEDIISYFSDDYSNYIEKKLNRYYLSDSVSGIDFKSASKIFFSNDFSYQFSEIAAMEDSANKYVSDYPGFNDSIFTLSNPLNFTKNDRQIGTINNYYSFSDFERIASQDTDAFIL